MAMLALLPLYTKCNTLVVYYKISLCNSIEELKILPAYTLPTHNKTCLDHTLLKTITTARCLISQTSLTDYNSVALYFAIPAKLEPANIFKRVDYNLVNLELTNVNFNTYH